MEVQSSKEILDRAEDLRKIAITKLYLLLLKNKEEIKLSDVEVVVNSLIAAPVFEVVSAMKKK